MGIVAINKLANFHLLLLKYSKEFVEQTKKIYLWFSPISYFFVTRKTRVWVCTLKHLLPTLTAATYSLTAATYSLTAATYILSSCCYLLSNCCYLLANSRYLLSNCCYLLSNSRYLLSNCCYLLFPCRKLPPSLAQAHVLYKTYGTGISQVQVQSSWTPHPPSHRFKQILFNAV